MNRLGHVARLRRRPDACVSIISSMYGFNAMEVQEALVKVQEQVRRERKGQEGERMRAVKAKNT